MTEITIQIPEDLFNKLKQAAQSAGMTTNQFLITIIEEKLEAIKNYGLTKTYTFAEMDEGLPLGKQPLARESLYER